MAEDTAKASTADKRAWRLPLRFTSIVTLVMLGAVVVASSLITQHVIRDQERLILRERTGEAAAVVGSAFAGVQESLQLLGAIAVTDHGNTQPFASAARSVHASRQLGLMVTTQRGTGMTVTASAGNALAVGKAISSDQQQLARRALATTGLVSGLLPDGSLRWLAFGLGRAAGPGTVVWEILPFARSTSVRSSAASPWGNLNIALYLSARPDPADLIVATTKNLPLAGLHYPFRVGAETWLLVSNSPRPLVGWLAQDMPWIILLIGAVAAALLIAVVETLARRRDYADALVEERTSSLRRAMTELETAQTRLVRQEKLAAVGQLASTVGHELRNPLAVVMNVLYLLESGMGTADDEAVRKHLATAKRETSAATLIVSDLLDYSASRQPMLTRVQLADLVGEAVSVVPAPAGVQVVQQSDPEIVVNADRDQLRQVLLNLITNGYEAMPDGGVLTVEASLADGSAQLKVTDTGQGMDDETRDSIFVPFYTTKARGVGLGLAVTRRVVEAHGGTITVDSTPSLGTSFTVTVPAAATIASVSL
jgi:signal transduction histidine kinase